MSLLKANLIAISLIPFFREANSGGTLLIESMVCSGILINSGTFQHRSKQLSSPSDSFI
jgi:hypothetical protein